MNYHISFFTLALMVTRCVTQDESSWYELYKKIFEGPVIEPRETLELLMRMLLLEPKDGFLCETRDYWRHAIELLIQKSEIDQRQCSNFQIENANSLVWNRYNNPIHANIRKYLNHYMHKLYRKCLADWKKTVSSLTDEEKFNLYLLKNIFIKQAAASNYDFTNLEKQTIELPEEIVHRSVVNFLQLQPNVLKKYLDGKKTIWPHQFRPLFNQLIQDVCDNPTGLLVSTRIYPLLVRNNDPIRHDQENFVIEWSLISRACRLISRNKIFLADEIHRALLEGDQRLRECIPRGVKFKDNNFVASDSPNNKALVSKVRSYIPFLP